MATEIHRDIASVGLLRTIEVYIANCFRRSSQPRIGELADYLGVSRYRLTRRFRALTGARLLDYINDFRVKRAIELLRDPGLTTAQIARQAGFGSARTLGRALRRIGKKPSEFRTEPLSSRK